MKPSVLAYQIECVVLGTHLESADDAMRRDTTQRRCAHSVMALMASVGLHHARSAQATWVLPLEKDELLRPRKRLL